MRKIHNDKKAFEILSKETFGVLVAIICLAILVPFSIAIYNSVTGKEKAKEAEASVNNRTLSEINRLNSGGEFNEQGIHIPNPVGWFLFSFTEEKKPNRCIGERCLCICEDVAYILDWEKRLFRKCDDKGSCIIVQNLKAFEKIKIEKGGTPILIKKINGEIEVSPKT